MPIRGMEDKREFDKDKLKELAFVDDLTGLYNRRYLYRYLPIELKDSHEVDEKLCLFMMDVDNFKEINDTYGHLCGDKILVEIAKILHQSFREGDTIIRYAGDEFVAILPGAPEDVALNIAKRILERIKNSSFKAIESRVDVQLTMSIGLAVFPRDAEDPQGLIHQADQALYSSKRKGRNRICTTKDILPEVLDESKLLSIFPSRQLIGREDALNNLKEFMNAAQKGAAKFVLVKGEKGIGKSSILKEFKKYAESQKIIHSKVSCSIEIGHQPYQVLIRALDSLFNSLEAEAGAFVKSLPPAQKMQLANNLPSLKKFLGEQELKQPKVASGRQGQMDLFKGICHSLVHLVRNHPLLLIIDDLQWVDQETLRLFSYIVKDLADLPIFILAACLEEDLIKRKEEGSPKALLEQIKKSHLAEELILNPLEKGDVQKMIKTIFAGIQLSSGFVDVIYQVSTGNPLFIEEILRSLVNKGLVYYENEEWKSKKITEASIPLLLKEAIQKRVTDLDEETKPVLSAAAVMGEAFDFDMLCKLLEKDPGYILEILDRAIKKHLIVSESPFKTDKFRFNSGAIRDTIYHNLAAKKRQDLHRKLAFMEESEYKDNLDSVVGSLGYHYGQAQDKDKASLYSDMLSEKLSQMPAYEDMFSFLQDALKAKTEIETVGALSAESIQYVGGMLRFLRLAINSIRLYPSQSGIRRDFREQAYRLLNKILDKDGSLVVGTVEGRVLINEGEVADKNFKDAEAVAWVDLMHELRIKSITFKKGLSEKELDDFLEILSRNYDEIVVEGGISQVLVKKKLSYIKINEVRYTATTDLEKQRAKFQEAMLFDYLIGRVTHLEGNKGAIAMQLVSEPARLATTLQKISEVVTPQKGEDKTEVQAEAVIKGLQKLNAQIPEQTSDAFKKQNRNIAEAMRALDFKLRSKILQSETGIAIAPGRDLIRDIAAQFSDKEILEMVRAEFSESKGNLTNLRRLISRFIMDAERRKELIPQLKACLADLGLDEQEISWVLGEELWQGLSLTEKAKRLLKLSGEDYIKLDLSEKTDKLILELLQNGQYKEAKDVIDKLVSHLDDKAEQIRITIIKDLSKISEMLMQQEKFFLLEEIINSFIARLDKEKNPKVYYLLAQFLAIICTKLIKKENFVQARGILVEFNARLAPGSKLLDVQKNVLQEAKYSAVATPQLLAWLGDLLAKKITAHQDLYEISDLMKAFGPVMIEPLFNLASAEESYADPFKSYALRWGIARIFREMPKESVLFLKDKLKDAGIGKVKVVLELLGHMQKKEALHYLQSLLKHKNAEVRKETINTLGKIGGSEAINLLSEFLKDKDRKIRLSTIWALGNIGTPEVLRILKPLLKDQEIAEEVNKVMRRIIEKK